MAPRLDSGALRYVHPFVFVMKSHSAQQPLHSALCFWEHFWNVFESWLTRSHTRTTLGGWVQPVHTRDTWRNVFFFSAHASSQVSRYIHSFLACFSPRSEAPDVKWCLDHMVSFMKPPRKPHLKRHETLYYFVMDNSQVESVTRRHGAAPPPAHF